MFSLNKWLGKRTKRRWVRRHVAHCDVTVMRSMETFSECICSGLFQGDWLHPYASGSLCRYWGNQYEKTRRQRPDTVPIDGLAPLTPWGREKMAAISQSTFLIAFSSMKMFESRLKFYWNLFRVQFTNSHHWFRWWLGPHRRQAITWTNDVSIHWRIYVSSGVDEFKCCTASVESVVAAYGESLHVENRSRRA